MPKIRVIFEKTVIEKMVEEVVVEAASIGSGLVSAARKVEDSWSYVSHEVIPIAEEAQNT